MIWEWISIREGGLVPVDIAERGDGVKRLPDGEGLGIGRLVPLVAAYTSVEDATGRADCRLAVTKRIPRDAHARGEVMPTGVRDAPRYSRVPGEQHPQRRRGNLG